ncbi:hypothetical protein J3R30DRAFT_1826333 [Lentinula aciculospora]|uniref:Uncharacterized protein n=1 Tax=Lentinula aciculospora TaxID=153920 RepID=A0A9W9AKD6_9AGAR|nr:hypothetical protein J3R30DRAFT_1826333 [Lentinula aciculospora]
MTVITVIMYCLSMLHLALSFEINLVALFEQKASSPMEGIPKSIENTENAFACTPIAAEALNCIIGDSIVIWRTWTLWNHSWKVIYFPCALLLGGMVAAGILVHAIFISLVGQSLFNPQTTAAMIVFCILTAMINFYAIVVIGYRAWSHNRDMKVFSGSGGVVMGRFGGRYLRIFLIFIESGFIYCIVPVLMMILFAASDNGTYIVIGILAQMTGIYPTAIIVLVCLQLTQHDSISQAEFAAGTMTTRLQRMNHDSQVEYTLTIPETVTTLSSGNSAYGTQPLMIRVVKDTDGLQNSSEQMAVNKSSLGSMV